LGGRTGPRRRETGEEEKERNGKRAEEGEVAGRENVRVVRVVVQLLLVCRGTTLLRRPATEAQQQQQQQQH